MAKFRLSKDSVLTINSQTIICVTDVTLDQAVDTFISECEDTNSFKAQILGGMTIGGTLTYEVEAVSATMLGYLAPKVAGAFLLQPADDTAGNIQITALDCRITGRSLATSRTGLVTGTGTFVLNDITVEVIPA